MAFLVADMETDPGQPQASGGDVEVAPVRVGGATIDVVELCPRNGEGHAQLHEREHAPQSSLHIRDGRVDSLDPSQIGG